MRLWTGPTAAAAAAAAAAIVDCGRGDGGRGDPRRRPQSRLPTPPPTHRQPWQAGGGLSSQDCAAETRRSSLSEHWPAPAPAPAVFLVQGPGCAAGHRFTESDEIIPT